MVWSRCDATGEQGFKPVLQTFVTHPVELVHLTYRRAAGRSHGSNYKGVSKGVRLLFVALFLGVCSLLSCLGLPGFLLLIFVAMLSIVATGGWLSSTKTRRDSGVPMSGSSRERLGSARHTIPYKHDAIK